MTSKSKKASRKRPARGGRHSCFCSAVEYGYLLATWSDMLPTEWQEDAIGLMRGERQQKNVAQP